MPKTLPVKRVAVKAAPEKLCEKTSGRMLVADPAAPGVPAQGGRPAIPAGLREATYREVWLWEAKVDVQLRGGLWTDETRARFITHYEREMTMLIREASPAKETHHAA